MAGQADLFRPLYVFGTPVMQKVFENAAICGNQFLWQRRIKNSVYIDSNAIWQMPRFFMEKHVPVLQVPSSPYARDNTGRFSI